LPRRIDVPTLTVRNVPDDAKHRFRQVAAAHGRSMEEHLRQLVIEADFGDVGPPRDQVAEAPQSFRHQRSGEDVVRELIRVADGAGSDLLHPRKYAEIRYLSAKDAMAELRRLANGVGLDRPPGMNTALEAPEF
jgi:hypothetical protein